jgi:hypothetical protein
MAELPSGLRSRRRPSDGKTEIIGTNAAGKEYVARVCDQNGVTDHDLKILDVGNPEKRDVDKFIGFYRDERDRARKDWERNMDAEYTEAAQQVVHAACHLSESKVGYSRAYSARWEKTFGNGDAS